MFISLLNMLHVRKGPGLNNTKGPSSTFCPLIIKFFLSPAKLNSFLSTAKLIFVCHLYN